MIYFDFKNPNMLKIAKTTQRTLSRSMDHYLINKLTFFWSSFQIIQNNLKKCQKTQKHNHPKT